MNRTKPPAVTGPVERPVGRLEPKRAAVGDVVAVDVRHPYPQTLRLTLETQAAADKANVLLSMEPKVWRLEKLLARSETPNVPVEAGPTVLRWTSPRTGG